MQCRLFAFLVIAIFIHISLPISAQGQNSKGSLISGNIVKISPIIQSVSNYSNSNRRIAQIEEQLRDKPNDSLLLNNLATRYVDIGRYDQALDAILRSVAADDNDATAQLNLGVIYEHLGKYQAAHTAIKKSLELSPDHPGAGQFLCELDVLMDRNAEAVKCFRNFNAMFEPTGRSRRNFGIALMRTGKKKESVKILEKAATLLPRDAPNQNALGTAYFLARKYKFAIKVLKIAVENSPGTDELRYNLGMSYLARKNRPGALSQYRILKSSDPRLAQMLYKQLFRGYILDASRPKK